MDHYQKGFVYKRAWNMLISLLWYSFLYKVHEIPKCDVQLLVGLHPALVGACHTLNNSGIIPSYDNKCGSGDILVHISLPVVAAS